MFVKIQITKILHLFFTLPGNPVQTVSNVKQRPMQTTVNLLLLKAALLAATSKKDTKNVFLYNLNTVSKDKELKIFVQGKMQIEV